MNGAIFPFATIHCLLLLSFTITASGQNKILPRVEHDTLFTVSGFKMYTGQTFKVNAPTGNRGEYRFIKGIGYNTTSKHYVSSMTILKMGKIEVTQANDVYINVKVNELWIDGSFNKGNVKINFEKAVNPQNGLAAEIVIL